MVSPPSSPSLLFLCPLRPLLSFLLLFILSADSHHSSLSQGGGELARGRLANPGSFTPYLPSLVRGGFRVGRSGEGGRGDVMISQRRRRRASGAFEGRGGACMEREELGVKC